MVRHLYKTNPTPAAPFDQLYHQQKLSRHLSKLFSDSLLVPSFFFPSLFVCVFFLLGERERERKKEQNGSVCRLAPSLSLTRLLMEVRLPSHCTSPPLCILKSQISHLPRCQFRRRDPRPLGAAYVDAQTNRHSPSSTQPPHKYQDELGCLRRWVWWCFWLQYSAKYWSNYV